MAPDYEKLGAKLTGSKEILIAKVDATAHKVDHPKVDVKGFPTLLFFQSARDGLFRVL